jgi:hypothetical protein
LLKNDFLRLFFTVDTFCGRVHTPLTNLHRPLRKDLLFFGNPIASLDVAQMQPTILGKILFENIGTNEFSTWLNDGKDIYCMLQSKANLETRDQGKKRFFEILFSKPNNQLVKLFGESDWITWINQTKSQRLEENPHSNKPHSNIAYLLQSTEVQIMAKVWERLAGANIPFISIHDEIIIQSHHLKQAHKIFDSVLQVEFNRYKLNNKAGDNPPAPTPKPSLFEMQRQWYCLMLEAQFKGEPQPENTLKLGRCDTISKATELINTHYQQVGNGFTEYRQRIEELININHLNPN